VGGEQNLLMDVFCENKGFMNGYFHAWVARKTSSWVFFVKILALKSVYYFLKRERIFNKLKK